MENKFLYSNEIKSYVKTAKPDFLFTLKDGKENIAVLDAKFKPQWIDRSSEHLTADIDECIRNLAVFQTKRTGVIFPSNSKSNFITLNIIGEETLKQVNMNLPFDVVEVGIPELKDLSFAEWNNKLNESVDKILRDYFSQGNTTQSP